VVPVSSEMSLPSTSAAADRRAVAGECPLCGGSNIEPWLKAPDRFHGRSHVYQLLRCQACSVIWTDAPPTPEDMGFHYGPQYDRLIAASGENSPDHWEKRRATLIKYKDHGKVLDLGCSSGSFLASLDRDKWELHGVEISPESAARAESRTGARIFVGDVLDATFPPNSFDAITCFHVFEHMYHPREVLAKAWEWLKPGGVFYAEMPNIGAGEARIYRSYWYPLELPRHLYHFSPESLRKLCTSLGFEERFMSTTRASFLEYHIRYIMNDWLAKVGIESKPASAVKPASLSWKVCRKALRMTVFPVVSRITSPGEGAIMHAVFEKPKNAAGDRL
jgi:SAM-dependent methyltransferase